MRISWKTPGLALLLASLAAIPASSASLAADKAASGLAAVAESFPDTYEQHEAVRHLLYYYPISTLIKPSSDQVHPASVLAARKVAPIVVDCAKRGVKPKWKKPWLMKASEEMEDGGSGAKPPQADAAQKPRRSNCL